MRGQKRNGTHADSKKYVVQPEECQSIRDLMFDLFDWVGTTELLSTETLPILSKLLNVSTISWKNYRVSKNKKDYVSFGRENVTASAIQTIIEMSKLDTKLYKETESRYHYDLDMIS